MSYKSTAYIALLPLMAVLALSACAQPELEPASPLQEALESAVPHVTHVVVENDSGYTDVYLAYSEVEDFNATDLSTAMETLEENQSLFEGTPKRTKIRIGFINPDKEYNMATSHHGNTISIQDYFNGDYPVEQEKLRQQVTPHFYADDSVYGDNRMGCTEVDGIQYDPSLSGGYSLNDYLDGGDEHCMSGIESGYFIP